MTVHAIEEIDPSGNNPYNMKLAPEIWQYKGWTIAKRGGVVANIPRPNPKNLSVIGLEHLDLNPGDRIMVAADNSMNPIYDANPNSKDPAILEISEIKSPLIGTIKTIRDGRIELRDELTVPAGDAGAGTVRWPKVGGAVSKIMGYNRKLMNERLADNIAKAQKRYGEAWKEKADDGAWLK